MRQSCRVIPTLPAHRVPRQDCRSYYTRPPQSLTAYSGAAGGATCVRLPLVPVGTIDISPVIYGRVSGSPHPFASRQGRLNEGRGNFKRPWRDAEKGVGACFTRCSKHRATIKRPTGRSYGNYLPACPRGSSSSIKYQPFRIKRHRRFALKKSSVPLRLCENPKTAHHTRYQSIYLTETQRHGESIFELATRTINAIFYIRTGLGSDVSYDAADDWAPRVPVEASARAK
jgi:hypothetical protein